MSRPIRWIQLLWLGASVAVLINVVVALWPDASPTRQPSIAFLGTLLVLSFPLGYLGFFLLGLLADGLAIASLEGIFANRFSEVIVLWIGLTAVGWLQWFVLVPWLIRALRKRLPTRGRGAA